MSPLRTPFLKGLCALLLAVCLSSAARADELPVAEGSPLAGVSFDDKPLALPIQRNFQMAMIASSSEIGRSCGAIEAYGWKLAGAEQGRVNQIFNGTVDKMRAQGFDLQTQSPSAVARDVTLFTADRKDRSLLFMWSAGDVGLVLVLCETSAPVEGRLGSIIERAHNPITDKTRRPTSSLDGMPLSSYANRKAAPLSKASSAVDTLHRELAEALPGNSFLTPKPTLAPSVSRTIGVLRTARPISLEGDWTGVYTCAQGTTGGTLTISSMKSNHFDGVFRFYPTLKNPYVPAGSYRVAGEYDPMQQKAIITPGVWLKRPANFYNAIIIGSFDLRGGTFSGYFQGIAGCTSFEATYHGARVLTEVLDEPPAKATKHKADKKKVKKPVAKKAKVKAAVVPESAAPKADAASGAVVESIKVPASALEGAAKPAAEAPTDPAASIALPEVPKP